MSAADVDVASALLRAVLGVTFVLHGWNHGFGPGGLAGTTSWFDSIGLRPARVHAAVSTWLELAVGAALLLGLLVPVAAAAGIGIMTTAAVTAHRGNGFFVFKDGWEYVLVIAVALTALATLGAGALSLDRALGLEASGAGLGAAVAAAGVGGAAAMLAVCWRPPARSTDAS